MQQTANYDYRGYLIQVYIPKKNEITASAMLELKEFIKKALEFENMKDYRLAPRENQVMALFADGKTDKEIAEILEIEECTVSSTLRNIRTKYGISGKRCDVKTVLTYLRNVERLK